MDPAVESSKAQSQNSCFLTVGQDNREMSACRGAETRTPNLLHPLVDKGTSHPYRKMHDGKRPRYANSSDPGPPGNKMSRAPRCHSSAFPSLCAGRSAKHKDTFPGERKLQSLGGRNGSAGMQFSLKARRSSWDISLDPEGYSITSQQLPKT